MAASPAARSPRCPAASARPPRPHRWPGWPELAEQRRDLAEQVGRRLEPALHHAHPSEHRGEPGLAVRVGPLDRHGVARLGGRGGLGDVAGFAEREAAGDDVHADRRELVLVGEVDAGGQGGVAVEDALGGAPGQGEGRPGVERRLGERRVAGLFVGRDVEQVPVDLERPGRRLR